MTFEIVDTGSSGSELADQINTLHGEMTGHMTMAVKKAIDIGRLLTEQKAELAHGEWIPWVERNLSFGDSMARKYMKVYANRERVPDLDVTSLRQAVALLAELREEQSADDELGTDPAPKGLAGIDTLLRQAAHAPDTISATDDDSEPESEPEYRNDPDLERELEEARRDAKFYENHIADVLRSMEAKERELAELRKLKADKVRVEQVLADLHELEKRKTEMFKDAESTRIVHQTLVRSREFFTREVMQIAALHIRPAAVQAMQDDFRGLIDLVENWLDAMKDRFLHE